MKPLLAFLAAFIAMAAADQEQILTALIFMGISVYLFTKSLPKWASKTSTVKSSTNNQSKPNRMTPSQPTSTGHLSSDSETIGSSMDQTPMTNAENISADSKSNPQSGREAGDIKYLYDKLRQLDTIKNLSFFDRMMISDIIWEAWYCGFNDRDTISKSWIFILICTTEI